MNEVRDAATVILVRKIGSKTFVLMGKRGSRAAFMPSKYVFPGGAWEINDSQVPIARALTRLDFSLLRLACDNAIASSIAVTAVRELWEETGLKLQAPISKVMPPENWEKFFDNNNGPDLSNLRFFFRAVTPPGRTRRFDARFFFCDASKIHDDLDDFSDASSELQDLRWVDLTDYSRLDLPIITTIALRHLSKSLKSQRDIKEVPFFKGGSDHKDNDLLKL